MIRLGLGTGLVAGALLSLANPISFLAFVAYGSMGFLLVIRRPRNVIGWLLLFIAAGSSIVAPSLRDWSREVVNGSAPGWIPWVLLVQRLFSTVGIGAGFALLAVLFPTGRWPRGGAGRLSALGLVLFGLLALVQASAPTLRIEVDALGTADVLVANPIGIAPGWPGWDVLEGWGGSFLLSGGLALCILAFIVRFRQSKGTERLQDKWLVVSLAFLFVTLLWGTVLVLAVGNDAASRMDGPTFLLASLVAWGPATLALPMPPVAIAVAVLRNHLYEIDRIISRTIGWAVVTGVLFALFAGGVLALEALLAGYTAGQTLAVAASTLAAFALFQPVRRRVQTAVDQRFDRARYDGERTSTAFAEQVRDEVDLSRLRAALVDTVDAAVRPVSAAVWLRLGSDRRR